jgi:hypothetical protein
MIPIRATALFLGLMAGPALAQTVTITGLDGQAKTVGAADLASMPRVKADLKREDGGVVHYEGVALSQLLQSVGAPSGHALRGPEMADIVVISAKDGYRVALALSDVDAGFTSRPAILADKADGAALSGSDGPFRLVVGGDARAARSARMVTAIKLERAP